MHSEVDLFHESVFEFTGQKSVWLYRVIQDKLENCRWLFETENMDRFLIKRYFWYRKSGKFHMVPWKIRKNVTRHSKSMLMPEFPFWNNRFLLVLYKYCMLWLWQRFWVPGGIFFWIFVVPYKISHPCDNKNTFWLKIYPCFLSHITIYNFPIWPETPCILISIEKVSAYHVWWVLIAITFPL